MCCSKPEQLHLHRAEFSVLRKRAELLAVKRIGNDLIKISVPGEGTEVHCIYSCNLGALTKYLHVCKFPAVLFNL